MSDDLDDDTTLVLSEKGKPEAKTSKEKGDGMVPSRKQKGDTRMPRNDLRVAPPLPDNTKDWQRASNRERTLNDLVEDVHMMLIDDPEQGDEYRAYLRAVYDAHAVEGSLAIDNGKAAELIRLRAKKIGSHELASEKLAPISMALNVVLRRYNMSRKQRRQMLNGEIVPPDHNDE